MSSYRGRAPAYPCPSEMPYHFILKKNSQNTQKPLMIDTKLIN